MELFFFLLTACCCCSDVAVVADDEVLTTRRGVSSLFISLEFRCRLSLNDLTRFLSPRNMMMSDVAKGGE